MSAPLLLALLACEAGGPQPGATLDPLDLGPLPEVADDSLLVPLDPPRLLRRMSLDLTGKLPSLDALDAVEADPAALPALREALLDDPDFEERFVHLLAQRWHTRVDEFILYHTEYPEFARDDAMEYPFERAIGEEPLRLMAHVAATDAPWTDIVTTDTTMANEVIGAVWPLDYPDGQTGWQVAHYTDGRPAAGVLSTNGLWWRYYSTLSNLNRGRAAAISRLLLCEDYLSRPVSFVDNVALVDADGVESALRSNPYCMGCHSSLDPLASGLFGFWVANEYNSDEMQAYHAEREPLGEYRLGVAPEYFGLDVSGLAELGWTIAEDPRFARCTARSTAELLWRRDVGVADFDRVEALRQAYLDGGESMRALLVAVTDSAPYQAGSLAADADDALLQAEATARLLDGELIDSVLFDLAGLSWQSEGADLLDSDTLGFRIMAGGVDGDQATRVQALPNLTWALTLERAAEGAAELAVADLGEPGALLAGVDGSTTPDDAPFGVAIEDLSWRLYAEHATDEETTELADLWDTTASAEGAGEAWRAVLVAMMRDPRFGSY